MSYVVQVDSSPVYELIVSLYCYIEHPTSKHNAFGKAWKTDVRRRLSDSLSERLEDHRLEVLHRLNLLVWQCPGERTVENFLHWLTNMAPGEIYEKLVPWVSSFKEDMNSVRDLIVSALHDWHEQYFRHIDPAFLRVLKHSGDQVAQLLPSTPAVELIEQCTNGIRVEPSPGIEKVLLVPQIHCNPYTVIDHYEGLIVCQYPVGMPATDPTVPSFKLMNTLKALSDENRLRILQYVAEEPRSFKEIAAYIGLVKSNVHYHLTALRLSGLLRSHYVKDKIESYSSRMGPLNHLESDIAAYIHRTHV
ncbi:ArsR/SmtB family transcription factor [Paenibacillus guangzhouensis]|uniref:ArsR/SmtB family transcription factor n=1 Tax=Paenibacillus guangzhouensis TaxID=1473112 RepID=UPI00187BBD60|nr:winged helix-turn-helix domain-containing protein [Paenibacillus guangzhouensis]